MSNLARPYRARHTIFTLRSLRYDLSSTIFPLVLVIGHECAPVRRTRSFSKGLGRALPEVDNAGPEWRPALLDTARSRDAAAGSSYYTQPVAALTKGNMTRAVRVIET